MRKMKKIKKQLIILLCTIMSTGFLSSLTTLQNVNAHTSYKLYFLFDPNLGRYMSQVAEEGATMSNGSESKGDDKHYDYSIGWNSYLNPNFSKDMTFTETTARADRISGYAEMMGIKDLDQENLPESWKPSGKFITENNKEHRTIPLSFPAFNMKGAKIFSIGYHNTGTAVDRDRATLIGNTLANSLNEALNFISINTSINFTNEPDVVMTWSERLALYSTKITKDLTPPAEKFSLQGKDKNNYEITLSPVKNDGSQSYITFIQTKPSYLEVYDYMKISISNKDDANIETAELYFPKSIYKGYYSKEKYGEQKPIKEAWEPEETEGDEQAITWKHLVTEAHISYLVHNLESKNAAELFQSNNSLEMQVIKFLDNCIGSIKSLLGLYKASELIFGIGQRGTYYYNNVMPNSWFERANAVFAVGMILAWMALFTSIIQISFKKNLSAISNIQSRVDIIEGYRNVIITGLILFMAIPFFYILSLISHNATLMLKSISPCSVNFGELQIINSGTFGYIASAAALLVFDVYMNFVYIYRALMATALYAISPLCIVTLAFTGRGNGTFINWMKSLISVLFLPVIQALAIAIIAPIFCNEYTRTIEILCILYAFIPLTKKITSLFNLDPFDDSGAKVLGGLTIGAGLAAMKKVKGSVSKKESEKTSNNNNDNNSDSGKKGTENNGNINKSNGSDIESAADKSKVPEGNLSNDGKDGTEPVDFENYEAKTGNINNNDDKKSSSGKVKEKISKIANTPYGKGALAVAQTAIGAAKIGAGVALEMGGATMGQSGFGGGLMNSGSKNLGKAKDHATDVTKVVGNAAKSGWEKSSNWVVENAKSSYKDIKESIGSHAEESKKQYDPSMNPGPVMNGINPKPIEEEPQTPINTNINTDTNTNTNFNTNLNTQNEVKDYYKSGEKYKIY